MAKSDCTISSIRASAPLDEGGSIARQGFAYQDHVALAYCVCMLYDPNLLEVWCETYDDIVLIWRNVSSERVEFVQVKGDQLDQLWSLHLLCQRTSAKAGTSILERSLSRDRVAEVASFTLVTRREAMSQLSTLALPRAHAMRTPESTEVKELVAAMEEKLGVCQSPNGNGLPYWVCNAEWVCRSTDQVQAETKLKIATLLATKGFPATSDQIDSVYETLLGTVKSAAEASWVYSEKKKLTATAFMTLFERAVKPHPTQSANGVLCVKLEAAGLDSTYVETAKELSRRYRAEALSPRYLNTSDNEEFSSAVVSKLLTLRSQLDSGEIPSDSLAFHAKCIEAVDTLAQAYSAGNTKLPEHIARGCMYEVVSRCLHRFVRVRA